jgi:hypothetical protein
MAIMSSPSQHSLESLADRYEADLARHRPGLRKANGIYYTPPALVTHVVEHTLGRWLRDRPPAEAGRIRILDPACGCGSFLVAAYQRLLEWSSARGQPLPAEQRRDLLRDGIYGVDLDAAAVSIARRTLAALAGDESLDLSGNIQQGNALLGPDWPDPAAQPLDWQQRFPRVPPEGFTVVIGNPPWGQKSIARNEPLKQYLGRRYPSSVGIFDLFRPFVELGVRLTAPGGHFGMVLPDIVLLKDYPATRRFLLDQLALDRIDWWGQAFAGAAIDTVTIIGRKQAAPADHAVTVQTGGQPAAILQADFRALPRHVFNLHLTPSRQQQLKRLAGFPRLGDYFAIHEGVHSGNIRRELFIDTWMDDSCRELYFGRDEIAPYRLRWRGRYLRLNALPARKTRERYANSGRPEWHERAKLLVRRTGDRVLAAVDDKGRWASNNFFLVFPKQPAALDLDGLCALLNSRLMTWYFRAIEPRRGRAFAELKIKHLTVFPLPLHDANGCARLNDLGRRRRDDPGLDAAIDELARTLIGVREDE